MLEIPTYPIIYMCIGCMGKSSKNIRCIQDVCERIQIAAPSGIDSCLSSVAISTHLLHCTQPINLQLMQSKCCCARSNTKINQPCAELVALSLFLSESECQYTENSPFSSSIIAHLKSVPVRNSANVARKCVCVHARQRNGSTKNASPMLNAHLHTFNWSTARTEQHIIIEKWKIPNDFLIISVTRRPCTIIPRRRIIVYMAYTIEAHTQIHTASVRARQTFQYIVISL